MYTLPRGGVQRGGTPSAGSGGPIPPAGGSGGKRAPSGGSREKPPKQKLPCKSILKFHCKSGPFIIRPQI
jgi:hypothetical protein